MNNDVIDALFLALAKLATQDKIPTQPEPENEADAEKIAAENEMIAAENKKIETLKKKVVINAKNIEYSNNEVALIKINNERVGDAAAAFSPRPSN